jgi:hypothetical protein
MLRYSYALNETCSVYIDDHGDQVHLGTGGVRLVEFSDLDVVALWQRWHHAWPQPAVSFREWLRTMLIWPDDVDALRQCDDCEEPLNEWSSYGTADGIVCEGCICNYTHCVRCEESIHTDVASYVGEDAACDSCYTYYTSSCENCGGRYWDDNGRCCVNNDCDCEAPHQEFLVPVSEGSDIRHNDEMFTVTLPGGMISHSGLCEIGSLLMNCRDDSVLMGNGESALHRASHLAHHVGNAWIDDSGAKYTTRLRKAIYKEEIAYHERHADGTYVLDEHGCYKMAVHTKTKIPADVLAKIGEIAQRNSRAIEVNVEVTRSLNLPADDFAHGSSCWWSEYGYSRCTLKNNGGFGIRSFRYRHNQIWQPSETGYGRWVDDTDSPLFKEVSGRVWALPMVRVTNNFQVNSGWERTADALHADAWLVFNAYGDLDEMAGVRVAQAMTGWSSKRVSFSGNDHRMYVNGDTAHLVARPEILDAAGGYVSISGVYEHPEVLPAPAPVMALA